MNINDLQSLILMGLLFLVLLNTILLVVLLLKRSGSTESKKDFSQETLIRDEFSRTRSEINTTFSNFSRVFNVQQEAIRSTVEKKLTELQVDNSNKLEKMRETVDEKLHKTLETRLGESFKIVSLQLEKVQQGLGEMQNIATGVGDLKKVLSNVKSKGVLGEMQLSAILEQVLTPTKYALNVKTKKNSNDLVEFAIKIPSKTTVGSTLWLTIDDKFPTEDYQRL